MCALLSPLAAPSLAAGAPVVSSARVTPLPPVPDPIGFAGAFAGVCRGHLLAAGGANFPDGKMPWDGGKKVWHDRIFLLDLAKPGAAWREAGKLPGPRGYGVALTTADGVLMIGGGDAAGHTAEVVMIGLADDGATIRRSLLPSLPLPLAQHGGVSIGRSIHVCGGIEHPDATSASPRHLVMDLDKPELGWRELPAPPGPARILATMAAVDDALYLAGGCSLHPDAAGKPARTYLRDAWKFQAGQWSRLPDLPRAAVAAASPAPVAGREFFIVSGDDGSQTNLASPTDHRGFPRDILCFDTVNDRWTSDGMLPVPGPVTLAIAPWRDGFVFFNGEVRPGVRTPTVFIFHPDSQPVP